MADDARESAAERLPADASGGIGAPDAGELLEIHDLFLVVDASLDDLLTPQAVHVAFTDGIADATWCRLEATWYTSGAYRFHYVDGNESTGGSTATRIHTRRRNISIDHRKRIRRPPSTRASRWRNRGWSPGRS